MEKILLKRYSLALKHQSVREYKAGAKANHLSQKYGITRGQ